MTIFLEGVFNIKFLALFTEYLTLQKELKVKILHFCGLITSLSLGL